MRFRLTYSGSLLAHRDDNRLPQRRAHVHEIRRRFHPQMRALWKNHPNLVEREQSANSGLSDSIAVIKEAKFVWRPLVTKRNHLICELDILMLRGGQPGEAIYDVDNRLKTVFDALRKVNGEQELPRDNSGEVICPTSDETPFFVLLEDDSLITRVSVATDTLLEDVPGSSPREAVRLVIEVLIRPYKTTIDNLDFV